MIRSSAFILAFAVLSTTVNADDEVYSIAEAIDSATVLTTFDTEGAQIRSVVPLDSRVAFLLNTGDSSIATVFDYDGTRVYRRTEEWRMGDDEVGPYSGTASIAVSADGLTVVETEVSYEGGPTRSVYSVERELQFDSISQPLRPSPDGSYFCTEFNEIEEGSFRVYDRTGRILYERICPLGWTLSVVDNQSAILAIRDSLWQIDMPSGQCVTSSTFESGAGGLGQCEYRTWVVTRDSTIGLIGRWFVEVRRPLNQPIWRSSAFERPCMIGFADEAPYLVAQWQGGDMRTEATVSLIELESASEIARSRVSPWSYACNASVTPYIEAYRGVIAMRERPAYGGDFVRRESLQTQFFQYSQADSALRGPVVFAGLYWRVQKSSLGLRMFRFLPTGEAQLISVPWEGGW